MSDASKTDHVAGLSADSDQFLTFTLQGEEYGIEILRVQEIKGFTKVRPIPNAPPYIKGAINLRGAVVPIIDLRSRFGLSEAEYNQFTVIIVVSMGAKVVGLVVDAVSDVLNIAREHIDESFTLGNDVETSFFRGMGKVGEKLVMLLDVDHLAASDKLGIPETAAV
jgi:purine-binding chemotaxis protein CheW